MENFGWVCPKCGKVYSPNITECYECNLGNITYSVVTFMGKIWQFVNGEWKDITEKGSNENES